VSGVRHGHGADRMKPLIAPLVSIAIACAFYVITFFWQTAVYVGVGHFFIVEGYAEIRTWDDYNEGWRVVISARSGDVPAFLGQIIPQYGTYARGTRWCRLPLWPVVMPPLVWLLLRSRKRRRSFTSLCRQCAYDLTGNASGVCPECGTPTDPPVTP
jgi:hypothetical protein